MRSIRVHIDPRTNIEYASFYIHGLYQLFGKKNVKFSLAPFKSLSGFEHFIAFVVDNGEHRVKIIIDYTDSKTINTSALSWSDVYGKINITASDLKLSSKLMAIGPSFGVKIFSLPQTVYYGISNFLKAFKSLKYKKQFLSSYKAQYKRPPLAVYHKAKSSKNYIFFLASLWKRETETNNYRANFIKSCKALPQINFEGGFVPRTKNDIPGFESITTERRLSTSAYFKKLKRSSIVFNTPAVKGCHGWKLAEYLALGKAIISTPLSRALPEPIMDNETVLISDGSITNCTEAIEILTNNTALRLRLEKNALSYYHNHLQPQVVIRRLLKATILKDL